MLLVCLSAAASVLYIKFLSLVPLIEFTVHRILHFSDSLTPFLGITDHPFLFQ